MFALALQQAAQNTGYPAHTGTGAGWVWLWIVIAIIVLIALFGFGGNYYRTRRGPPTTLP